MGYEEPHQQVKRAAFTGDLRLTFGLSFRTEYITIVSIMVCMTVWDFVIGVLFGIIASCTLVMLSFPSRNIG